MFSLIKRKELKMKRLFILLGVLVGLSSMTFAQEKAERKGKGKKPMNREWKKSHSPEDMAKMRTEHLDKLVNLNETQKEQIYGLHLEQANKQKERREVMIQRFRAHQESINEILTAEQQELLKEKRVSARKDHQPRGRRNFEGKNNYRKDIKPSDDKAKG